MYPNNELRRETYRAEDLVEQRERSAEAAAAAKRATAPQPGLIARALAAVRRLVSRG